MIDQQSNEDFSIFYYIKGIFDPLGISTVDEFPVQDLVVPSVALETAELEPIVGEMGNTHRVYFRVYYIDYFAVNKSQRQQMGYTILRALESSIPVWDYNEGFPPDAPPITQLGCMQILNIKQENILINPELVSKLYYRGRVSFETYFNRL